MSNFFEFQTITGEPTKLNYLQQCIVRSSNFKRWFGDWQKESIKIGIKQVSNFNILEKYNKITSKAIDKDTLEPQVFFHGTIVDDQFFEFDTTQKTPNYVMGMAVKKRPYGYFAENKEYSENFSNRPAGAKKSFLYDVFLQTFMPFDATVFNAEKFKVKHFKRLIPILIHQQNYDYESLLLPNTQTIGDFYDPINRQFYTDKYKEIIDDVDDLLQGYDDNNDEFIFWQIMANDREQNFKDLLKKYGFDAVSYEEQFNPYSYDVNDKTTYTKAFAVFNPVQIKYANGANVYFDPNNPDIRYFEGGKTHVNTHPTNTKANEIFNKYMPKFANGGMVEQDRRTKTNDAKRGGYFVGKSHAEGGIKAKNVDTGEYLEVEGNEVIITKKAVADTNKRLFEGEMLTNREILSKINVGGGGVSFANGGEMQKCRCSGKTYKYGGETKNDYQIINMMNYE
jgi:hypothetical protein